MKLGFSLVELSIVLVILGLLTGGILAGQSLIRASELRSVTTQYNSYITAAQSFRDKYFMIPGDLSNARSFWGTATACPSDGLVQTYALATCNGDGDGFLEYLLADTPTSNEEYRFWQHLVNAGLIEGAYTGMSLNNNGYSRIPSIGNNIPRSRISNAAFAMFGYPAQAADDASMFAHSRFNGMMLGIPQNNTPYFNGALKPEEAWNIDMKMDDGLPATGYVNTPSSGNSRGGTNCATTSVTSTAAYELTTTSNACSLIFQTKL